MKYNNKSLKTLLGTSAASLLLATSVQAFPGGSHGKGDSQCRKGKFKNMTPEQRETKMKKRFERMAKKLNLTDSQQKQVEAIFAQNKSKRQSLHTQAKTLRDQLKTQRQSNAADASLDATHDQLYAVKTQMRQLKRSERRQIDAILTPEQRAKAKEMMEKRMQRHGERGEHGRHHKHG